MLLLGQPRCWRPLPCRQWPLLYNHHPGTEGGLGKSIVTKPIKTYLCLPYYISLLQLTHNTERAVLTINALDEGCWKYFVAFCLHRSTKLVIIERLLLLAERYVITIEASLTAFWNKMFVFVPGPATCGENMFVFFMIGYVLSSSHYSTSWGLI